MTCLSLLGLWQRFLGINSLPFCQRQRRQQLRRLHISSYLISRVITVFSRAGHCKYDADHSCEDQPWWPRFRHDRVHRRNACDRGVRHDHRTGHNGRDGRAAGDSLAYTYLIGRSPRRSPFIAGSRDTTYVGYVRADEQVEPVDLVNFALIGAPTSIGELPRTGTSVYQ